MSWFMTSGAIEVYVGDLINYFSERTTFQFVVEHLAARGGTALVLANFTCGRQIDLLVATDRRTFVIEAKAVRGRVTGGANGEWGWIRRGGERVSYGNAYQQALAAKNYLRDRMIAVVGRTVGYPDGAVVFAAGHPAFSGDYCPASATVRQVEVFH
jgi:hypothetical protein